MKFDAPILIVAARRSAIGCLGGGFKSLSAADLALAVAESVAAELIKAKIDHVMLGQGLQAGAGMNVARQVGLRLGLLQTTPAFTTNMVCGSGLKAVALAAASIASGESSLVLAGGVESMSRAPHYAAEVRWGSKLGHVTLADAIMADCLSDPVLKLVMGETAERIADAFHISREEQDTFALTSQQRAVASRAQFEREIVAIQTSAGVIAHDEHPRADTTLEKLAQLKPAFRPHGTVTAGNSSGINDGAALLLLASAAVVKREQFAPRARIVAATSVGCDPALMGLGPIGAIRRLCAETGWRIEDLDAVELNEAFAAQAIACARELHIDPEKLNRRGGAIALGHPIGCSGARILVTLLHILEDAKLKRGIAAICVGGGMGIALAIETEGQSSS